MSRNPWLNRTPHPEPEVLPTDDWEIGIPDGPPEPQGDTIARVGEVGVEPPVFTKRVSPNYPEKAVKIRLQGYVILEAILRKDGLRRRYQSVTGPWQRQVRL